VLILGLGGMMADDKWFDNKADLPVIKLVELDKQYRIDSLVCAIEEMIHKKERGGTDLCEEEVLVLAVEAMEREVNNGGFAQFFANDSWIFSSFLGDCLMRIRAVETSELARLAVSALAVPDLTSKAEIDSALEDGAVLEKLEELDARYFQTSDNIERLLFDFIKENVSCFR
jgi:hypothetical protein